MLELKKTKIKPATQGPTHTQENPQPTIPPRNKQQHFMKPNHAKTKQQTIMDLFTAKTKPEESEAEKPKTKTSDQKNQQNQQILIQTIAQPNTGKNECDSKPTNQHSGEPSQCTKPNQPERETKPDNKETIQAENQSRA